MAHDWNALFTSLPSDELDKVALLRMIECTNGVIQHLFRDEASDALSVEETRIAMKFSMGCIKNMSIPLGDEMITFAPATADAIGLLSWALSPSWAASMGLLAVLATAFWTIASKQ